MSSLMGHLGAVKVRIPLSLFPFDISDSHLCSVSSCLGLDSLRQFSFKIWRPPCSKPEDNPDDATETI
jgi:hypothetical protein